MREGEEKGRGGGGGRKREKYREGAWGRQRGRERSRATGGGGIPAHLALQERVLDSKTAPDAPFCSLAA